MGRTKTKINSLENWQIIIGVIGIALIIIGLFQTRKALQFNANEQSKPIFKIVNIGKTTIDTILIEVKRDPIYFQQYIVDLTPIIRQIHNYTVKLSVSATLEVSQELWIKNVGNAKGRFQFIATHDTNSYEYFIRDLMKDPKAFIENVYTSKFNETSNEEILPSDSILYTYKRYFQIIPSMKQVIRHILFVYEDNNQIHETYSILNFNLNQPLLSEPIGDLNNINVYIDDEKYLNFMKFELYKSKTSFRDYNKKDSRKFIRINRKMSKKYFNNELVLSDGIKYQ